MPYKDPELQRAAWRRWYYRNPQAIRDFEKKHQKLVREFLRAERSKGCERCPENRPDVIDFHHVRGKKVANIGNVVRFGWSIERIKSEIAKCERICANCHRVEHAKDRAPRTG